MNNSQFPTARTNGLVIQEVPEEVLVFDTESNNAHCLNQTAAMVWKACDGKTSVPDIAQIIGSQTGNEISDDLVWLAIDQLNEHKLLETQIVSKFAGESRRDVLKKIGLASMVALPIIASLAAPKSVLAATSCSCPSGPGAQGNFECSLQAPACAATCQASSLCA
jgi:hypothetical protein